MDLFVATLKAGKQKLRALIPRRLKYTLIADIIEWVLAKTTWLDGGDEPPGLIQFSGRGFVPIGNHLINLMAERAGLADGMSVLEIGCGMGRNAVALSKRFPNTRYLGFDIVRFGIRWCRKRFAKQATFRFQHIDIHNSFYNPRGTANASTLSFPAENDHYDFVFATSVFTHMRGPEVARYLEESHRCLSEGGRAYFTCFILDPESSGQIASGASKFKFPHAGEGCFVESREEPDLAVAYEHTAFESLAKQVGFELVAFFPGHWRGVAYPDFQDAYVLRKS